MGVPSRLVESILVVGLLASCGGDSDAPAKPTVPSTVVTSSDALSKTFAVGGGQRLHLACLGTGSPTVILEAGDEAGVSAWSPVMSRISERTRVCAYDRAGIGSSSAATGCRDMDDILGDKFALLDAAGLQGPYVLVGASGGGYLAAEHAMRNSRDTVGLVIVDTFPAITNPPPELARQLKCDAPANIEHRDYRAVEHAAWDHRHRIGDQPVVVISNRYGATATNADERNSVRGQRGWFDLSPHHRQVVVSSGHDVAWNEPDVVVDAVLGVIAEAN